MAKVDLKALRAQLKKDQEQQNLPSTNDNASFPFWKVDVDGQSILRFLPDGDDDNMYFWRERAMINLTFDGIVGQPASAGKEIKVQVPCMEMYGEDEICPVLTEARKFYKSGDDELGQKYWKKRTYIYQGFVRATSLQEENPPENPIRRFLINPSINKIIYQYIMDDDNEDSPTDYDNGCDFRINKTKSGSYDDYGTSNFARKNTPLTDEELEAIEKYGLFNLWDFLPKKPDADALRVIQEMFESSLDGEPYDPTKFANYYRPYGLEYDPNAVKDNEPKAKTERKVSPKVEEDHGEPEDEKPMNETGKPSAKELLERLRNKS